MWTLHRKATAEEDMENDKAASVKPDGAHTHQDLDWAWHMITEQYSLLTQANAPAQQNQEGGTPVQCLRRTKWTSNAARDTAAADFLDASSQPDSDASERAKSGQDQAGKANDNTSGNISNGRVDVNINDTAEYADDMPNSDGDTDATDDDLNEDNEFWHMDDVANEIHTDGAVSHKYNCYSVLYDTIERANRAEASNLTMKWKRKTIWIMTPIT